MINLKIPDLNNSKIAHGINGILTYKVKQELEKYIVVIEGLFNEIISSDNGIEYERAMVDLEGYNRSEVIIEKTKKGTTKIIPFRSECYSNDINQAVRLWFADIMGKISGEFLKNKNKVVWKMFWRCKPEFSMTVDFETMKPQYWVGSRIGIWSEDAPAKKET